LVNNKFPFGTLEMEAASRDDRNNFKDEQVKSIIGSNSFNGV